MISWLLVAQEHIFISSQADLINIRKCAKFQNLRVAIGDQKKNRTLAELADQIADEMVFIDSLREKINKNIFAFHVRSGPYSKLITYLIRSALDIW